MASAPLTSIDILWLLLCSVLVMLMQAGFCSIEAGLVRTKNSVNVAMKNLLDFMVAGLVFLLLGYGLIYGPSMFGFVGHPWRWFEAELDLRGQVTLLFQLMLCGAAVTIVSGAVAERMRLAVYLVVSVWVAAVVYPLLRIGHGTPRKAGWRNWDSLILRDRPWCTPSGAGRRLRWCC